MNTRVAPPNILAVPPEPPSDIAASPTPPRQKRVPKNCRGNARTKPAEKPAREPAAAPSADPPVKTHAPTPQITVAPMTCPARFSPKREKIASRREYMPCAVAPPPQPACARRRGVGEGLVLPEVVHGLLDRQFDWTVRRMTLLRSWVESMRKPPPEEPQVSSR